MHFLFALSKELMKYADDSFDQKTLSANNQAKCLDFVENKQSTQ